MEFAFNYPDWYSTFYFGLFHSLNLNYEYAFQQRNPGEKIQLSTI